MDDQLQRPGAQRPPAAKSRQRSPQEVVSWVTGVSYCPKDLERDFFSTHFTRVLDDVGYACLRCWRL
jgi:hypothetical protein